MDEAFAWDRAASRLAEMSSSEYVEAPWRPKSGAWLLEQAKVTEVVPESVLRALWRATTPTTTACWTRASWSVCSAT